MKGGDIKMKIKVFNITSGTNEELEKQVNDFISNKKVIDMKQSECIACNQANESPMYSFTLLIMYEEYSSSYEYAVKPD